MKFIQRALRCAVVLAVMAGSSGAQSQAYPVKPVRVIVPFAAGGAVDAMARAFGQKFAESWGQQVVVENRAGAGGNIGADAVAKAAPDGYTLLMTTTGHAVAPSLYRKLPFDPIKDFAPISQITSTYLVLVANPKVPASSLRDLVALAKSQPNKLNYGHTGLGVAPHMVGEMLRLGAGIEFALIPYKGDAPVVSALLATEVDMSFLPPTGVVEHVKAGRLKAFAVTGTTRGSAFPDVPTTTEAGQPEAAYVGWVSLFGPGGTPRDILSKVSSETARVLKMPDIAARLPGWGGEAAGTSPDEFAAKYRADIARYARIIKAANVPLVE